MEINNRKYSVVPFKARIMFSNNPPPAAGLLQKTVSVSLKSSESKIVPKSFVRFSMDFIIEKLHLEKQVKLPS